MPVEKTQLLATVGRILGRIQIDGDVSHLAFTPSVSLDETSETPDLGTDKLTSRLVPFSVHARLMGP